MIIGITGKMGSGKTLTMTYFAHLYRQKGFHIFSNYGQKFKHTELTLDMLMEMDDDMQDAILCMDEIHIFLDSRQSAKKRNRIISYFITQSRKRNIILIYTTQSIDQVDKRLRSNTDYSIECQKVVINGKTFIHSRLVDLTTGRAKRFTLQGDSIFPLYDTHQIIDFTKGGE